jgi:hypothetical protein
MSFLNEREIFPLYSFAPLLLFAQMCFKCKKSLMINNTLHYLPVIGSNFVWQVMPVSVIWPEAGLFLVIHTNKIQTWSILLCQREYSALQSELIKYIKYNPP